MWEWIVIGVLALGFFWLALGYVAFKGHCDDLWGQCSERTQEVASNSSVVRRLGRESNAHDAAIARIDDILDPNLGPGWFLDKEGTVEVLVNMACVEAVLSWIDVEHGPTVDVFMANEKLQIIGPVGIRFKEAFFKFRGVPKEEAGKPPAREVTRSVRLEVEDDG